MSIFDSFSPVRRLSQLGTILQTCLSGREVGGDAFGNRYYHSRHTPKGGREKRWVIYAGEPEASKVPPEWHIWLHYTADAPIPDSARRVWQKPHIENMTGTPDAWFPLASQDSKASEKSGAYQAWQPE